MSLPLKATLLAGIPLLIMTAIGIALLAQGNAADGRATLAVGVIVAATASASLIYQVERWSLRTQTLVHFAIMLVTVLPALLFSGWFPLDNGWGYVAAFGAFLGAGAVLWALFYVIFAKLIPRKAPRSESADGTA